MKITFLTHSITFDNEADLASGWNDIELSPEGIKRIEAWAKDINLSDIDAVYASDLQRAYKTAQIAFPEITTRKLFLDWRLRECDYGDLTQHPKSTEVDPARAQHIDNPFPNGESYTQAMARMESFVNDLRKLPHKHVLVIGSRATHYGLDVHIDGKSIEECLAHKFVWQPGWTFELT
ncbi:histidine phosphatase family protein [Candidatus Saccharibacteria bacterium]|nr:MAG: histidine phosphatase family protein [Candidatus Saccharibacteria bacterium]